MKMKHSLTLVIILILLVFSIISEARLRDFETTRLKSTGGTGVGSILMDESTVLNPAPIAFFQNTSFYFQKTSGNITPENSSNPHSAPLEIDNLAAIVSDSGKELSGSLSYQKSKDRFDERQRIGFSTSRRINDTTAFGVAMRLTTDSLSTNGKDIQKIKYNQFVFGTTHILSDSVTVGVAFIDPLKKREEDTKAVLGGQYVYKDFIFLMADMGADYNKTLSETLLYRGALQFKVFKDFFVKAGFFSDKAKHEKGSGVGASWVQPKLMLDFAIKNTEISESEYTSAEKIKETSFSFSYRF